MAKHLLYDKTILKAKPGHKSQRLNDGEGLYLLVKPNGAKWWRFDYTIDGTRKTLSLGVYPVASLAEVRVRANECRAKIDKGIDPSETRKQEKSEKQLVAENTKRLEAGLLILSSIEHVTREYMASIAHMEWNDVDLDAKEWRYFVTKTEVQHVVPLSVQALAILEAIKPLTGNGQYVFPSSCGGLPPSIQEYRHD